MTSIQWTDHTWNCVLGCSRVDHRCDNCYAMGVAHRGLRPEHRGLTKLRGREAKRPGVDWNGTVRFVPERLAEPLRMRKGKRIFVNSMSDLFHESLPFEQVAAVFGVMAATQRHTYQVLSKRWGRALEFFAWLDGEQKRLGGSRYDTILGYAADLLVGPEWDQALERAGLDRSLPECEPWPLPNVQLIASVSDQSSADHDIPLLLQCPAAVHGVSYEPALGPVDFRRFVWPTHWHWDARFPTPEEAVAAGARAERRRQELVSSDARFLDWVIVGGESGPRARLFNVAWAHSVVEQCRAAGVPVFIKQLGSKPYHCAGHDRPAAMGNGPSIDCGGANPMCPPWLFDDSAAGDWDEWPKRLRVRKFPRTPQPESEE